MACVKVIAVSINPEDVLSQCIEILDRIIGDDSVPRNLRRSAENIKSTLSNKDEPPSLRSAMVISMLDDMSNDPNLPLHIRPLIWNLASQLETIPMDS